jgi:hypothetical protein
MPLKMQDLLAERWTLSKDRESLEVTLEGVRLAHIQQNGSGLLREGPGVERAKLRCQLLTAAQNAYRLALMFGGLAKQRAERGDTLSGGVVLTEVEWRLLRELARDVLTVTGDL